MKPRSWRPARQPYVILHRQSETLLKAHSARWQTNTEQLHAEFPVLHRLQQLAYPVPWRQARVASACLITLAVMVVSFLIGLAGAFVRLGSNLLGGVDALNESSPLNQQSLVLWRHASGVPPSSPDAPKPCYLPLTCPHT